MYQHNWLYISLDLIPFEYTIFFVPDWNQSMWDWSWLYFHYLQSVWVAPMNYMSLWSLHLISLWRELQYQFETDWDVRQWLDLTWPKWHLMLALCCRVKSKSRIDCERLCCWYSNIDEYSREKIPCIDSCSTVHKNTSFQKAHASYLGAREELIEICYVVECCSLCE